jgi:hypothetical protein
MYVATQVRTAATPTSEWKAATSWGRSVISIRLAMVVPMAAPPVREASTYLFENFSLFTRLNSETTSSYLKKYT